MPTPAEQPATARRGNPRLRFILFALACTALLATSLLPGGAVSGLDLFERGSSMILALRGWRLLLGATVGSGLAVAGLIMQGVLRNPLADPYVLGLSAGAGLGTAGAIALGLATPWLMPFCGFGGACLSLILVLLLGGQTRHQTSGLLLAGVAWSAICSSLLMLAVTRSDQPGMHALVWWFLGDLQVTHPPLVCTAALLTVIGLLLAFRYSTTITLLSLGDDLATHLGVRPVIARRLLLGVATVLAGSCVAAAGVIGFVGLVAPHLVRRVLGAGHPWLVPATALTGAAWVTSADAIGRMVAYPREWPVGVVCALAGAPFFLWLLRRGAAWR